MRALSTPIYSFVSPVDIELIDKVRVNFSTETHEIVKENKDITFEGKNIIVRLTQEDTFSFNENDFVKIELQILTTGDDSLISNKISERIEKTSFKEVLK